ncbi:MAG TPA: folylpolyglutamate synthase/dihydrofolate synthase family protein [Bacteroidota bacterium]
MFDTYKESVRSLFDLEQFGMKFGLQGIRTLLGTIGNPQNAFPCIHVAGTNGKGSTSSMLAAVFTAAGYRTGLYTSPHLISFTERIRIDGKEIPRNEVVRLTNLIQRQVRKQKATFFEAVTAMAFRYFADSDIDIAIVETGLGGRLDATNVVRPLVSVITNVGLEHTEILGNTLEKIAWEKGGIIKRNVPCVTGVRGKGPLGVIRARAKDLAAPLSTTGRMKIKVKRSTLDGLTLDAAVGRTNYRGLRVSLSGDHQALNAGVVLKTLDVVRRQGHYNIGHDDIYEGLSNVRELAGLEARLSVVRRNPLVLVDVAHNPDGINRLVESLLRLAIRNVFLVFGVVRDKDYRAMIGSLRRITRKAILTKARTGRARPVKDLALEFQKCGIDVVGTNANVASAVRSALERSDPRTPILITGSHFVVGEALAFLRSRKFT